MWPGPHLQGISSYSVFLGESLYKGACKSYYSCIWCRYGMSAGVPCKPVRGMHWFALIEGGTTSMLRDVFHPVCLEDCCLCKANKSWFLSFSHWSVPLLLALKKIRTFWQYKYPCLTSDYQLLGGVKVGEENCLHARDFPEPSGQPMRNRTWRHFGVIQQGLSYVHIYLWFPSWESLALFSWSHSLMVIIVQFSLIFISLLPGTASHRECFMCLVWIMCHRFYIIRTFQLFTQYPHRLGAPSGCGIPPAWLLVSLKTFVKTF